jgi:hypothetical protein
MYHSAGLSANRVPDRVRLSDIEPHFACEACVGCGATFGRSNKVETTTGQLDPVGGMGTPRICRYGALLSH